MHAAGLAQRPPTARAEAVAAANRHVWLALGAGVLLVGGVLACAGLMLRARHGRTFEMVQFVHVHKAAGSSVCALLQDEGHAPLDGNGWNDCNPGHAGAERRPCTDPRASAFCVHGYDVCWLKGASPSDLEAGWSAHREDGVRVVASEGPVPAQRANSNNVAWITGLREPVARQLSEYAWFKSFRCNAKHLKQLDERNETMQTDQCGCMQAPCGVSREAYLEAMCDNYMVRTFCPSLTTPGAPVSREALACAKVELARFDAVYVVERMDEGAALLRAKLGVWLGSGNVSQHNGGGSAPAVNVHEQHTSSSHAPDTVTDVEAALLASKTALDAELYEYAAALFDAQMKRWRAR